MATNDQYFSLVQTSCSSWVAVPVNRSQSADAKPQDVASTANALSDDAEQVLSVPQSAELSLSERFPRLAIAVIAILIFAVSVSAEIEYLRQSGYSFQR